MTFPNHNFQVSQFNQRNERSVISATPTDQRIICSVISAEIYLREVEEEGAPASLPARPIRWAVGKHFLGKFGTFWSIIAIFDTHMSGNPGAMVTKCSKQRKEIEIWKSPFQE